MDVSALLLGWFLSPGGLVVLAALDSTIVFFLPFAVDGVIVYLAAKNPDLVWLIPFLGAAGSMVGGAFTVWVGRRAGEEGLERFISRPVLTRVERAVEGWGEAALAALAIIPPPFPYTAFLLTAGAFATTPRRFLVLFGLFRLARYGVEVGLATVYGPRIVETMESDAFRLAIVGLAVLAVAGTAFSAWRVVRRRG